MNTHIVTPYQTGRAIEMRLRLEIMRARGQMIIMTAKTARLSGLDPLNPPSDVKIIPDKIPMRRT